MTNQQVSRTTTVNFTTINSTTTTTRSIRFGRLVPLAAAAALLGAACGSTTTTSTAPVEAEPASRVVRPDAATTDPPVTDSVPVVASAPPTPATTAAPAVTTAPCGESGDVPPLPDGLNPQLFDTDGDGDLDPVQPYPDSGDPYAEGSQAWTVRVVENDVISEAPIPGTASFVGIAGSVDVDGRAHVIVRNHDNDDLHTYATNDDGCVELISTEPGVDPGPDPTEDLVLTNPAVPVPTVPAPKTPVTVAPVLVAPTPAPGPCGDFDPIPETATITSNLEVDLVGDGTANDRVITYLDSDFVLRTVRDGVTSEIVVPDVGASTVAALGVGDVGELSPGNEVVARTGGGASSVGIDFFGHDADDCVFEFTLNGGELDMAVGATVGWSSGVFCEVGVIGGSYHQLDDDGTFYGSGAAYFESSAGDFTYLPASDHFSEGLTLAELPPASLDCFGFGL